MTIKDLPSGTNARVVAVDPESPMSRRLMEMGLIPGASVTVVKTAPFGDPIEIRVSGYSLAMRKNEADSVEVSV